MWRATNPDASKDEAEEKPMTRDQALEKEVEQLTIDIGHALRLSNSHERQVRNQLGEENNQSEIQAGVKKTEAVEKSRTQNETSMDGSQADSSVPQVSGKDE